MAEGDLYIGIRYEFEDGAYWELMTVCEKNAVTDCARNSALERFMYKEEYVGKTYEQAFQDLRKKLCEVKDAYEDFLAAMITYAAKKQERYVRVMDFLKKNPDALSSDILWFVSNQEDFMEDAAYCVKKDEL